MVKDEILKLLDSALKEVGIEEKAELQVPVNTSHGDYSTNIAMKSAGKLKKNPLELADEIATKVRGDAIEKVEVLKPGFINFWVSKKYLLDFLKNKKYEEHPDVYKGKKIIIEYTDPNPFKEFHIGHIYSNVIGESLARLFEGLDGEVARVNYQGDVGLHVAKALWGLMKLMEEKSLSLDDLKKMDLSDRVKLMAKGYALGSSEYESNKDEINLLNKKIYDKSPEVKELYDMGRKWSLEYFELIYQKLGTKFDLYFFESEVADKAIEIVKKHKDIFEESEGAIIFDGEKYGLHKRVFVNSLGLPTYEAKDLALAPLKYEEFKYDESIIVTGNEVVDYFRVVIKAMSLINEDLAKKTKHVSHGMVRLPEGKMASRTGNIIAGEWLIETVTQDVLKKMKDQDRESAEKIAIGAIKYFLLKTNPGKDVIFNVDDAISLEGDTGPYIQYTFVRCKSILSKAPSNSGKLGDMNEDENELLRLLIKFNEIVEYSSRNLSPNTLCLFLYNLSRQFNLFYQKNSVLKSPGEQQALRLALTKAVEYTLQKGLGLLGINTVERM